MPRSSSISRGAGGRRWRRAPAAAAGGALLAACLATGALGSGRPEPAPAGAEAGRGRLTGALRFALWAEGQAAAAAPAGGTGLSGRRVAEALGRHFLVEADEPSPRARFKAVLATGSESEVALLRGAGARIRGRVGRAVSFDAPLRDAARFAALPPVRTLDIAKKVMPELDLSRPEVGADAVQDPLGNPATGSGVIGAGVDTGHDITHRDFRRSNGSTRFKSVLNMDPTCRGPRPASHPYACYFTEKALNGRLRGRGKVDYEDVGDLLGHGSHTLGIAAGNGLASGRRVPKGTYTGVAPGADLIGVRLAADDGRFVGDLTEALEFLVEEQARLGNPPLVVNLSLGHQFGDHAGDDPDEVAIDDMIQEGLDLGIRRVVVKSAGNSELDGIYYTSGASSSRNGSFTVPSTYVDASGNEVPCGTNGGTFNDLVLIDIWYPADAILRVGVRGPAGYPYHVNYTGNDPARAAFVTAYGTLLVDCPAAARPGGRECLAGVLDAYPAGVPAEGRWSVEISGAPYDAWIVAAQMGACTWGWDAPDPGRSISIPGTAFNVITVGAYLTKTSWQSLSGETVGYLDPALAAGEIAPFSSRGPTRDGRLKPEIAAPGMGIASVRARTVSTKRDTEGYLRTVRDGKHLVLEGTSMSAPHVAGAAALLLELDPNLTALEIRRILEESARADAATGTVPNTAWGAGKLDVLAASERVLALRGGCSQAP
jgi:subtilisin family serine protease